MPYYDLSLETILKLAESIPTRTRVRALHERIQTVRTLVNGEDKFNIPDSHLGHMSAENHEGSLRLNARIEDLAAWFTRATPRFILKAPGPGQDVRRGSSTQERFARRGETELMRGTMLHNWHDETLRDFAEIGLSVIQQHRTSDYYQSVEDEPDRMREGAKLTDLIFTKRIDPATIGWVEDEKGELAAFTVSGTRELGELADLFGDDVLQKAKGWFDWSLEQDKNDRDSPSVGVETVEFWGANQGALVIMGGPKANDSFKGATTDRVVKNWSHGVGRPPFYLAHVGPWPWSAPLGEMIELTAMRNYYATMLDIQTGGAIFRHWQLVDTDTGEDLSFTPRNTAPEAIRYDLSKPPPFMGPGTEWKIAPFEFHDVSVRGEQVRRQHEAAGAAVAMLVGDALGKDTAVGTVDAIDDVAARRFSQYTEAISRQMEARWKQIYRDLRSHKDPVFVHDQKRDREDSPGSFLSVATTLKGDEIVTEDVEVKLDTRSPLAKIRDFRMAIEMVSSGFMDYKRAVEQGLIPGVDDADEELMALGLSEAERLVMTSKLKQLQAQLMQNQGSAQPPSVEDAPRFLAGNRTDPRSMGTQRGPDNVSDTGLAAGASDLARAV